jgi:hypothetical protein
LSCEARLEYLKWPHIPDELMKRYLIENRNEIFPQKNISDSQIERFVKLFDSSFIDLQAIRMKKDFDNYMNRRLSNRRDDLALMRVHDYAFLSVLEKIYSAENHRIRVKDLRAIGEPNYLSYVDEASCAFHDRLTLHAMAEELKSLPQKNEKKE